MHALCIAAAAEAEPLSLMAPPAVLTVEGSAFMHDDSGRLLMAKTGKRKELHTKATTVLELRCCGTQCSRK